MIETSLTGMDLTETASSAIPLPEGPPPKAAWRKWSLHSWREAVTIRLRLRSAESRMTPDFIVIGAQKSGTTFLYRNLVAQPGVLPAYKKEIHFFDRRYGKGMAWYRAHFPLRPAGTGSGNAGRPITGESSPYYLFHPAVPRRVQAALPEVRLIAVLRNPVDRAYSHFQHERRRGVETHGFAEALELEAARLAGEEAQILGDPAYDSHAHRKFSYFARGVYVDQLARWLERFPTERILVLKSEAMYADPGSALGRVMGFLGQDLPETRVPHANRPKQYSAIDPETRRRLEERFAPHNERLYRFLRERSTPAHPLEIEPFE